VQQVRDVEGKRQGCLAHRPENFNADDLQPRVTRRHEIREEPRVRVEWS
jgi:hypothetical protein